MFANCIVENILHESNKIISMVSDLAQIYSSDMVFIRSVRWT